MTIKEFKENDYKNYLETIKNVSYSDILDSLSNVKYEKPLSISWLSTKHKNKNIRDNVKKVEEAFDHGMPMLTLELDNILERNNYSFPNHIDFRDSYIENNKAQIKSALEKVGLSDEDEDVMNLVKWHVDRSYPSVIRDIITAKFVESFFENNPLYKVIVNRELDWKYKIDIMICGPNGNWGIHLFTKTANAEFQKRRKDREQYYAFSNVTDVDWEIDVTNKSDYNGLYLYGEEEWEELLDKITKINNLK